MIKALFNLVGIQFKEFYREPEIIFWALIFPISLVLVLGVAFTQPPNNQYNIAIIQDESAPDDKVKNLSEQLSHTTTSNTSFKVSNITQNAAMLQLKRGNIDLFITFGKTNEPILHYDPNNAEARMAKLVIENELYKAKSKAINLETSTITTPGNRYIDFLIPGLLAMSIMNSCLWGVGWSMIELRIKKLMRRMVATPLKKPTFLASYMVTRLIMGLIELGILFSFAYFIFNVTIQGSLTGIILIYIAGYFAFSGIAVLASSRAKRTQVGNGIINAISLPMILLSGIFFSYESFPKWVATIIEWLPLTLLADALRALFNEGISMTAILPQLLVLVTTGFICFIIGIKIYKWY